MRIADIPMLGFGTFGRGNVEGQRAIETALEVGYRHIDTAQTYDTEQECGQAIAGSNLPRGDLFVTTKITPENFGPGKLIPSLKQSLDNLQLDDVDLTLIHWPSPHGEVPLSIYLEQLAQAQTAGLTRLIGVSNFTIPLLREAREILRGVSIATNQFELHPFLQNQTLAEYCHANGIAVTAYRPIAEGRVNNDPVIRKIADRHAATPAQVSLAFLRQSGFIAIPTSGKPERIQENFDALKVTLSPDDIRDMKTTNKNERYIDPDWGPVWDK